MENYYFVTICTTTNPNGQPTVFKTYLVEDIFGADAARRRVMDEWVGSEFAKEYKMVSSRPVAKAQCVEGIYFINSD